MANTHLDPSREYLRDHPNESFSLGTQVACECECAHHFDGDPDRAHHHRYGQPFPIEMTTEVLTMFGKFRVCKGCADDLAKYNICSRCNLPLEQCFCKSRREG